MMLAENKAMKQCLMFVAAMFLQSALVFSEEIKIIRTFSTIVPVQTLVKEIGRDRVSAEAVIAPGANPHVFELKPKQLIDISRGDAYFFVGSGIEFEDAWLEKIRAMNRKMLYCDTSKGITLLDTAASVGASDQHIHAHKKDPHIWLSPRNAKIMAQNILDAFIQMDSQSKSFYVQNAETLTQRLDALDQKLTAILGNKQTKEFVMFHPAWQYFASDYGLREVAIESEGKEMTPAQLGSVITMARDLHIKTFFASPFVDQRSILMIANQVKARVVTIDELAADYEPNLLRFAEELNRA